jgi:D-glycero-D-manno-heptose 1,7-bisphosphate phosphatase
MKEGGGRAAVLFDRDGTLNASPATFVTSLQEFIPIPGAFEGVGRLCRAGWGVAVCTNQSCIGQGIASAETIEEIHRECARLAASHGGRFDGFHVCPHRPDENCACRKPRPGLLLEAALRHGYDLTRSFFVGDTMRDLEAGRAAGATALLVMTGGDERARAAQPPELVFPDVAAAVDWILRGDRVMGGP